MEGDIPAVRSEKREMWAEKGKRFVNDGGGEDGNHPGMTSAGLFVKF